MNALTVWTGEQIVESKVKNSILAYMREGTPRFSVMDIYSTKRAEVGQEITKYLNSKLKEEYGIDVLLRNSDVRLDKELQAKVQAERAGETGRRKGRNWISRPLLHRARRTKPKRKRIKAVTITNAQAEAEANRIVSDSITDNLIKMKEAEAREKHGWVTVQGADTVVTEEK